MKEFRWKLFTTLSILIVLLFVIIFFVSVDNNVIGKVIKSGQDYYIICDEKLLSTKLEYNFENFSSATYFKYSFTENNINYYHVKLDKIPEDNILIIKNGKIKIYELIFNLF